MEFVGADFFNACGVPGNDNALTLVSLWAPVVLVWHPLILAVLACLDTACSVSF